MSGDGVKAYMYLLAESWLQEPRATLPMDDNELASMARVTQEQWQIIRAQVVDCFKVGKCDEHKNCFYNELLLEISRKYENKQRFNNKNAECSQIITEKPISDNDNSISVLSFNSLKEGEEGEGFGGGGRGAGSPEAAAASELGLLCSSTLLRLRLPIP